MAQQRRRQGQGRRSRTAAAEVEQHLAALGGRYSLQRVLGEGSFGQVWEARHRRTGQQVAIKIVARAAGCKVEREIMVMRLLNHPHIIRLYEAVPGDRHTYIVMELAGAGQLHDHVAIQGRLPEGQARAVFRQLASGAAYCHHNMVAHRDLKMENVLLDSGGDVKIVDLGFGKLLTKPLMRRCCGSPEYAAPELHQGRRYVGPRADVWSCGVILYGMLCGCLPFDGADHSDLRRNILRGHFRLPPLLSDDARDLIAGMLIVRPEKRMSMAEVMAHRWLQPAGMPPYLAMPPLDASLQQPTVVDGQAVEQVAMRHGLDRATLLTSLIHGQEDEATVAYNLILSKQYDAATRYLWCQPHPQLNLNHGHSTGGGSSSSSSSRGPWALGGLDELLHECPRETMRRIAKALQQLGILFCTPASSCSCNRHQHHRRLVCAHFRFPLPSAAVVHSLLRLTTNSSDALEMNNHILESLSAAVFFEIQLYKAGEGNHRYVLDLKRISGPQLGYLHLCSQLIAMLRRPAATIH